MNGEILGKPIHHASGAQTVTDARTYERTDRRRSLIAISEFSAGTGSFPSTNQKKSPECADTRGCTAADRTTDSSDVVELRASGVDLIICPLRGMASCTTPLSISANETDPSHSSGQLAAISS